MGKSLLCCLRSLATRYHVSAIYFVTEIGPGLQVTLIFCCLLCGFSNGTRHFRMVLLRKSDALEMFQNAKGVLGQKHSISLTTSQWELGMDLFQTEGCPDIIK